MSELLPCPFCGGEAFVRIDITLNQMQSRYRVGCDKDSNCHGWYGHSRYYSTEAEAIAAWNSRAERITDDEWESYKHSVPATEENMAKFGWVRERTCEFNIKDNMNESEGMGDVWIECSACHCVFDYYADEWLMNMSYCPNCGAKVVK